VSTTVTGPAPEGGDKTPYVVVLGGANMDLKARSAAPLVAATSNPGSTRMSPGGVGRNIAENLARLGTTVHLVAAVGADAMGDTLLRDTAAAGVGVDHVRRLALPTGTYTAVLDATGELSVAVADMAATDSITPDAVVDAAPLIAGASLVVVDANLAHETVAAAVERASAAGVPVVVDPVSVPKARRLRPLLTSDHPVHTITPNADELEALTGLPTRRHPEVVEAARSLTARGVERVWVRLGSVGSLLVTGDGPAVVVAALSAEVADVTGAGDAMLAAYCHALLGGAEPGDAAAFGQAAAALTVSVADTVRSDLTDDLVRTTLAAARP
jgi:pseudouridine kinase